MRISVSGSFSTGKTSVVNAVVQRLQSSGGPRVGVISEVARRVLAQGHLLDRDATIESYLCYVREQLTAERRHWGNRYVLSDRSLLDLLAYVRVNDDPAIPQDFPPLLEEIVWQETRFFDLYCYLPVEFEPVPDGEREVDPTYQREVAGEMRRLLDEFGVPVRDLRGSLEERTQALLQCLRG